MFHNLTNDGIVFQADSKLDAVEPVLIISDGSMLSGSSESFDGEKIIISNDIYELQFSTEEIRSTIAKTPVNLVQSLSVSFLEDKTVRVKCENVDDFIQNLVDESLLLLDHRNETKIKTVKLVEDIPTVISNYVSISDHEDEKTAIKPLSLNEDIPTVINNSVSTSNHEEEETAIKTLTLDEEVLNKTLFVSHHGDKAAVIKTKDCVLPKVINNCSLILDHEDEETMLKTENLNDITQDVKNKSLLISEYKDEEAIVKTEELSEMIQDVNNKSPLMSDRENEEAMIKTEELSEMIQDVNNKYLLMSEHRKEEAMVKTENLDEIIQEVINKIVRIIDDKSKCFSTKFERLKSLKKKLENSQKQSDAVMNSLRTKTSIHEDRISTVKREVDDMIAIFREKQIKFSRNSKKNSVQFGK